LITIKVALLAIWRPFFLATSMRRKVGAPISLRVPLVQASSAVQSTTWTGAQINGFDPSKSGPKRRTRRTAQWLLNLQTRV